MREDLRIRLEQFKAGCSVDAAVQSRVIRPPVRFIGDEILELAVSALLQGENILFFHFAAPPYSKSMRGSATLYRMSVIKFRMTIREARKMVVPMIMV